MSKLTYPALVRRLYDLRALAEPPRPGECSGCFSSYDRRSRYNSASGQYEDWDANRDGSGYIRKEGEGIVVFEADGPGVIWRVWSALPEAGHIRIYIDGSDEATIDCPFHDFFSTFGDEMPPLNFPDLAPTLSRGRNRFIPIPYNRQCKIVLDPGWGRYYHFTYTTFPDDVTLPSFNADISREAAIALATADRILSQRGGRAPDGPGSTSETVQVTVPARSTALVASIDGNRAITAMQVVPSLPPTPEDRDPLRELVLQIQWDGELEPSVWSPLGDFFGGAPGITPYRSLPLGMTDAGLYSHWYMPFADNARIELINDGDEARTVSFTIVHERLERDGNELLRFHAKWHRDAFLEQVQQNGREIDWPLLLTDGPGRFCGIHLHVWNRWREPEQRADEWWYGLWDRKSIDWWWGEGDEKFFVDGEKFPSTFGTGSEDYIGYAWAAEPPFPTFESAFACQPYIELNANGHTAVNRFHICDNIPFMRSFEGCIEKYKPNHWGDDNVCLYAVVAYWYQKAGQADPYQPIPLCERKGYYRELAKGPE
jgi:hypothetical protein